MNLLIIRFINLYNNGLYGKPNIVTFKYLLINPTLVLILILGSDLRLPISNEILLLIAC